MKRLLIITGIFVAIILWSALLVNINREEQECCNGRNCINYSLFNPETGERIK